MADIEYLTVDHISTKDLTRIFSKMSIDPTINWNGTPCWIWTAGIRRNYASIKWNGAGEFVHRITYAWLVASLPRRKKGDKPSIGNAMDEFTGTVPFDTGIVSSDTSSPNPARHPVPVNRR